MKWKAGRISDLVLLLLTIISISFFLLLEGSKSRHKSKYFEEKLRAAEYMKRGIDILKEKRLSLGIPIDLINDPNATGLIGHQTSPITTTRGDLSDKLTSTNPNIAALFVEFLKELKIKSGDTIAAGFSGSYPGLNLALLSACKSLDIYPVIITSIGSSMWGANDPQFTWLDMEKVLYEGGLFPWRSVAASIGGGNDIGMGLSREGIELVKEAARRNGVSLIEVKNLEESVERRIQIFEKYSKNIRAYIRIGEGAFKIEETTKEERFPQGIIRKLKRGERVGVDILSHFLSKGIPVINFQNIEDLAKKYGLPVSPIPLPEPGEGKLYYEIRYSTPLAALLAIVLGILLFAFIRFDLSRFLIQQRS
jgi:poly-gamma-glutamate system protein